MSTLAKLLVSLGLDSSEYSSGIQKAEQQTKGLGNTLKTAAGTALGFVGAMAGMAVVRGAFDFVKDSAIGMNATLENSTLQFTTLTGDADFAAQHIKDLFTLGASTPFETQNLINASATMETFGGRALDSEHNLRLFGDAAAATNAAGANMGQHLEDIAYWSSRMNAAMMSGRPVIETANALQRLGVISPQTMNELIKMQAAGASGAAMWAVYQKGLDRFTGAMALQSQTWAGLSSSISDNAHMIVATAFAPLFEQGKKALTGLLTFLNNLAASGAPEKFANGLRFVIAVLVEFGSRFVAYAQLAYAWGSNIAAQFAAGIAAAINLIVGVMQQIGAVIASWLSPGSPPKITPDLEKWGAEAATLYFNSWAKGDTSAFSSLASTLQATLKGLGDVGQMSKEGIIPTLLAGRSGMQKLFTELSTLGDVSQQTFDDMVSSMGPAGKQIAGLVKAYINLSKATKEVENAQSELNDITEHYAQILTPMTGAMKALKDRDQEIKDMQRVAELNAKLADGSLDEQDAELARNEIAEIGLQHQIDGVNKEKDAVTQAAQAKLDAAKVAQTAAQDQVNVQQQAIDNQNETNSLIGQQMALLEQMAKSAKGSGASAGGGAMPTIAMPKIDTSSLTDVAAQIAETQAKASAFVDNIQAKFSAFGSGLAAVAAPFIAFGAMVSNGIAVITPTVMAVVGIVIPLFQSLWGGIVAGMMNIAPQWDNLMVTFNKIVPVFGVIAQVVGTLVLGIVGFIAGALPSAIFVIGNVVQVVLGVVNIAADLVMGFVGIIVGLLTGDFAGAWQATLTMLSNIGAGFMQILGGLVNIVFATIGGLINGVIKFFQTLYDVIIGHSIIPDLVSGIITAISTLATTILSSIGTMVTDTIAKFTQMKDDALKAVTDGFNDIMKFIGDQVTIFATSAAKVGTAIVDGIKKGITDAWNRLTSWLTDKMKGLVDAAASAIGAHSPSTMFADQVGVPAILGVIEGMNKTMPKVLGWITGNLGKKLADYLGIAAGLVRSSGIDVFKNMLDLKAIPSFQPLIDANKAVEDIRQHSIDVAQKLADVNSEIENTKGLENTVQNNIKLTELYKTQADLLAEQAKNKQAGLAASVAQGAADLADDTQRFAIAKIADEAQAAYAQAQQQALVLMQSDAKGALEFFNQRKAQINELAQLEKDRALATTDQQRADLDTQIALTKAAQEAEKAQQNATININMPGGHTGTGLLGDQNIIAIIERALKAAGITVDIRTRTA